MLLSLGSVSPTLKKLDSILIRHKASLKWWLIKHVCMCQLWKIKQWVGIYFVLNTFSSSVLLSFSLSLSPRVQKEPKRLWIAAVLSPVTSVRTKNLKIQLTANNGFGSLLLLLKTHFPAPAPPPAWIYLLTAQGICILLWFECLESLCLITLNDYELCSLFSLLHCCVDVHQIFHLCCLF